MSSDNLVQSVSRALDIMEILNEESELGVTQMSKRLGLDKSTAYRLLNTLKRRGYVRQDPSSRRYSNTYKLFQMGIVEVYRLGFMHKAKPYMEYLAGETGETVNLAILDSGNVIYIDKIESREIIKADISIGRSYPAYATGLGKAILAFLPEERVAVLFGNGKFIRYTDYTVDSLSDLLSDLRNIRRRGYAMDNEEFIPGLACIAAPLRDSSGYPLAAISVSYPKYRCVSGCKQERRMTKFVLSASLGLSKELGFCGTFGNATVPFSPETPEISTKEKGSDERRG